MLAKEFKRTKILVTLGPASKEATQVERLMEAGANGFRLNFSHGDPLEFKAMIKSIRAASAKLGRPAAVVADLAGPKIRVGELPLEGVAFVRGHDVQLSSGADYEAAGVIPIQFDFSGYVRSDQRIFLRDGQIELKVTKVAKGVVQAKVAVPGLLMSHQGINLPDTQFDGGTLTDKDWADIDFAAKNDVDYVAVSFVQSAAEIKAVRAKLTELKSDIAIIAKIETKPAVRNLLEIVQSSDGVMVARGDLAVEVGQEVVPVLQRQVVNLARQQQKLVVVATQMLESMVESPQPTRAEVSDVATAVNEGADVVMLSGETAVGHHPIEATQTMKRVILYTEQNVEPPTAVMNLARSDKDHAISAAAVTLAEKVGAKVIVAETSSGRTARNISSFRPAVPIIMATHRRRVYFQLALVWGGKSFLLEEPAGAAEVVMRRLKSVGNVHPGDMIVVASGQHPGMTGGTDTVQVRAVA